MKKNYIALSLFLCLFACKQANNDENNETVKKIPLINNTAHDTIRIHDSFYIEKTIHDTLYHWDIDAKKIKAKRLKLLCIDSYGLDNIEVGKIYTTIAKTFMGPNDTCYYIDGIGNY